MIGFVTTIFQNWQWISTDGILRICQATFESIDIHMCSPTQTLKFTFMAVYTTHNLTFSLSVIEAINHCSEFGVWFIYTTIQEGYRSTFQGKINFIAYQIIICTKICKTLHILYIIRKTGTCAEMLENKALLSIRLSWHFYISLFSFSF